MTETIPPKPLRMNRQHEYDRRPDRFGFDGCIYCNQHQPNPLTLEHIIPEGLGGALTIPKASCDECANETHAFEGHAMNMMRPVRRQLNFPQKRRGARGREKRKEERFILQLDHGKAKVPIEEFPPLLLSLVYPLPGILLHQKPEDKPLTGGVYSAEVLEGFGEKLNRIRTRFRASRIGIMGVEPTRHADEGDYGRMLAKIAHAYACAELGCGNFRPFLVQIIRGIKPYYLPYFIGSALGKSQPPLEDLHHIEIDQAGLGLGRFIVVKIRLFANRSTPTHYVVVGEKLIP